MVVSNTPTIELPLSKSIVNRLLTLFALRGHTPESVGFRIDWSQQADDIQILHRALFETAVSPSASAESYTRIDIDNCGTAMRFLTAYFAQQEGRRVVLTGCERMQKRPIGQLVDALRSLGADIEYMGQAGYPPLRITGRSIDRRPVFISHPLSTQFISALLLIGVPATTDTPSPYITLTQDIIAAYTAYEKTATEKTISADSTATEKTTSIEKPIYLRPECLGDWSAAAFWYEYIALHGGRLCFSNLADTGQGDCIAASFFAHLGVQTTHNKGYIYIEKESKEKQNTTSKKPTQFSQNSDKSRTTPEGRTLEWDFRTCPDLYPAAAIACEQLGIRLIATGTESLPLKESDRLRAVAEHKTYNDHRIAMALLAADLPCDNTACISKSYPAFVEQLHETQLALGQES